ncbi:MAG: V-type ATP synthase subunit I, partial [Spirochaetales bacterium]|nr:V-type ATP synthase subunit I [Spirochaetales bacterium]
FDLLGALPGYHEYDISFWFLLFFSLFFAMIIGDAGYGFIFLSMTLAAIFMRKSKGKPAGLELTLLTVLSAVTIVWGALSGTWFGSEAIAEAPPFKYLILQPISSFNPKSSDTIKYMCFVIGTVHVTLAHGWSFISQLRQKPRIKALGQLGWMMIVLGAFYFVLNLVLDPIKYPIPNFALYMVAGGIALVVLFANQEGNFLRGLVKGFAGLFQTFLSSISAFADVISYIRLFAVGLATVEIAKSFNAMAADMGNSLVGLIGSILVLIIGHGINLIMGALSVIVHGVRLNMLEFSSHLGMEWSGIPYDPFSQKFTTTSTKK